MLDTTWKWKLNDKRTQDKYIEKGLVDKAQVQTMMKNLPDEAANATWVEIDMEDGQLGEEEMNDTSSDNESESNP